MLFKFHVLEFELILEFFLSSDEKSIYNDSHMPVNESSSQSSNSSFSSTLTDVKRDPETRSSASIIQLANSLHQNLIATSVASLATAEASPRKKPRKQNVYVLLVFVLINVLILHYNFYIYFS